MGSRGSTSASNKKVRYDATTQQTGSKKKRGQYSSWVDNDTARSLLQQETGFSDLETQEAFNTMIEYFGGDYKAFRKGKKQQETKIIDNALKHMGAYDGTIYRGMNFDQAAWQAFSDLYKVGSTLKFNSLSSWSSSRFAANQFAGAYGGEYRVIFVCNNNKSAVGVQHISKFGSGEAEVLAPSSAQWTVKDVTVTNKAGYTEVIFEVAEK